MDQDVVQSHGSTIHQRPATGLQHRKSLPSGERLLCGVLLDYPHFAMYSFVLLKIHGQDQAIYFLTIPSEEWPRAVDARPSNPQHQPSTDGDEEGSDSQEAGGNDTRMEYVREKLRGKRPTDKEPSSKQRKIARPSRGEEGSVHIGASNQPRRR